jgi:hypothetical protein
METIHYTRRHSLRISLITWILVMLFATYTPPVRAQSSTQGQGDEPKLFVQAVCLIVGGIVAGIIIWELVKMCKKIPTSPPPDPDDPPPPPPPTNYPPVAVASPNPVGPLDLHPLDSSLPLVRIDMGVNGDNGVDWWDIRGRTNAGPYETLMVTGIQSSPDMTNWVAELYVLGWTSRDTNNGVMLVAAYDANWKLLITRYGEMGTNSFVDISDAIKPQPGDKRFYRSFVPQKLRN